MRRVPWAVYMWPGLPQLWWRGAWSGLVLAVGFAALLNLALLASLVWTEWLGSMSRTSLWGLVMTLWCCSSGFAWWICRRENDPCGPKSARDLFPDAQDQYLKGNWLETERLLHDLLRRDETDAEAALLLATLYRHTGRWDEADAELRRLERRDVAAGWRREIEDEDQRLAEARAQREASSEREDSESPGRSSATLDHAA
jgi:hypothetical protein